MPQKKTERKGVQVTAAPRLPINGGGGGNDCGSGSDTIIAGATGPATIAINGTVQLQGTATEAKIAPNCNLTETPAAFSWSLFFTPPDGAETNVSGALANTTSLTPTFLANSFGSYRAVITASPKTAGSRAASRIAEVVIAVFKPMELFESEGIVTFLRANEVGDSFGPPGDAIQVEAICQLDSLPGFSFGFELRNDKQRPAHQAMFDLLEQSFVNDLNVLIDYLIPEGNKNGTIIRVALTK
jgi:hypothetical protein